MNDKRRSKLKSAAVTLQDVKNILERVQEEEQDALDNVPENLEFSRHVEEMEFAVDSIDDAISSIEDAVDSITEILA